MAEHPMTNEAGNVDSPQQKLPFWRRFVRGLDKTSNAALIVAGLIAPTQAFLFWFYPIRYFDAIFFLLVILVVPTFAYALLRVLWNRKLWIGLAASIILWALYPETNYLSMRLFVSVNGSEMSSLASDILSDRKIWKLSARERYSNWINGYHTTFDDGVSGDGLYEYFADCLKADSIPAERVGRYINQLRDLNVQDFWILGDKVVFRSQTWTRRDHGFVFSAARDTLPTSDSLYAGEIRKAHLKHITGQLYVYLY